jgi:hypothetical protein
MGPVFNPLFQCDFRDGKSPVTANANRDVMTPPKARLSRFLKGKNLAPQAVGVANSCP